jgi:hypothetical protein
MKNYQCKNSIINTNSAMSMEMMISLISAGKTYTHTIIVIPIGFQNVKNRYDKPEESR